MILENNIMDLLILGQEIFPLIDRDIERELITKVILEEMEAMVVKEEKAVKMGYANYL